MANTTDDLKNKVPARCWHYLLDFGDQDGWKTLGLLYKVGSLRDLTVDQFWNYLSVAMDADRRNFYKPQKTN